MTLSPPVSAEPGLPLTLLEARHVRRSPQFCGNVLEAVRVTSE